MEATRELDKDAARESAPHAEAEPASEAKLAKDDPAEDEVSSDPKRKPKGKIKFESVMQRSEAVVYFTALIDGLRHGHLQFRHGKQDLSLSPSEQVAIEVKASRKGNKEKVAFELEWRQADGDARELER